MPSVRCTLTDARNLTQNSGVMCDLMPSAYLTVRAEPPEEGEGWLCHSMVSTLTAFGFQKMALRGLCTMDIKTLMEPKKKILHSSRDQKVLNQAGTLIVFLATPDWRWLSEAAL